MEPAFSIPKPEWEDEPRQLWITKKEGARLLHVSLRQIERQMAASRIRAHRETRLPHEKTAPVLISRDDVFALRVGKPNYYPSGEIAAKPANLDASKAQTIVNAGAVLDKLVAALALPRPAPLKPWLSIPEAAAFSGLPADFLRARAPELERRGEAVNVAAGSRAHWRILRSSLERPLPIDTGSSTDC
jgi:hypothetical protein